MDKISNDLAPICLFVYKRSDTLKQVIEALQKNSLAKDSELFIFSDGFKNDNDYNDVAHVREYIKTINGFKKVIIKESEINKGLAQSIIDGVTEVINLFKKVIVLEDDLITAPNFLHFMNTALTYFEKEKDIFSIAGYTPNIKKPKDDIYFTQRASSWGWATWENKWENIDWDIKDYDLFVKDKKEQRRFNKMGSDMSKMLKYQMNNRISSWAIRWCYHQFRQAQYTVVPTISKVLNIGIGESATHTKDRHNRFLTELDNTDEINFKFDKKIELEKYYLRFFLNQFSIQTRIKYKLLNFFVS